MIKVHRSHTRLVRDEGRALRPAKTEGTVSYRQNNKCSVGGLVYFAAFSFNSCVMRQGVTKTGTETQTDRDRHDSPTLTYVSKACRHLDTTTFLLHLTCILGHIFHTLHVSYNVPSTSYTYLTTYLPHLTCILQHILHMYFTCRHVPMHA